MKNLLEKIKRNNMKILGIEFKTSNWGLASNKKFKLIADIILYTFPLYSGAVAILGSGAPKFALWFNFALSVVMITVKAISKFTAEPVVEPTDVETPVEDVNVAG